MRYLAHIATFCIAYIVGASLRAKPVYAVLLYMPKALNPCLYHNQHPRDDDNDCELHDMANARTYLEWQAKMYE